MATDPPDDLEPADRDNEDDEPSASPDNSTEPAAWARSMKFGIDMSPAYRSIVPKIDFAPIHRQMKFGIDTSAFYGSIVPKIDRQMKFGIDTSGILRSSKPGTGDTTGLFSGILAANRWLSQDFYSGLARTIEELRREHLRQAALPSNLRAISGLTSEDVLEFTEKYAVSLYLVAPTSVARSLLKRQGHQLNSTHSW